MQELLADATLAGDWTLDGAKSTIGLQSKIIWGLIPVKGAFDQVTGHGTVSPAGEVSGTITVAAASIDTKNAKRDKTCGPATFSRPTPSHTSPSACCHSVLPCLTLIWLCK
jgi:polyisoprenoid-binding protein YceI